MIGVSCEADQQVRCAYLQMHKLWTVEMLLIMSFVWRYQSMRGIVHHNLAWQFSPPIISLPSVLSLLNILPIIIQIKTYRSCSVYFTINTSSNPRIWHCLKIWSIYKGKLKKYSILEYKTMNNPEEEMNQKCVLAKASHTAYRLIQISQLAGVRLLW